MANNKVAIIILNWNGQHLLKNCFNSVYKQTFKNFKIIFVDNGSTDGSVNYIKEKYPKAKIVSIKENLGYTGGNNIGIKKALIDGYEYILVLNNDTELFQDCLEKMIKIIEKDEKIGVVGPLIYEFPKEERKIYYGYGLMDFKIGSPRNIEKIDESKVYDVDSLLGCAFLVRSEVYKIVGLTPEDFYMYWDDYDFLQRVKKANYKIKFVPAAKLYHICGASSKNTNFPRMYYQTRNRLMLVKKYAPLIDKTIFYAYFAIKFPYFIYKKNSNRERYLSLLGTFDFLINRMGKKTDFYFFKSL